jgi:hypothetical protein
MAKTKLSSIFKNMKHEGYVIAPLDKYLSEMSAKDNDRVINTNAPSQIGNCMRANFYARTGVQPDNDFIEPRTRRIFDNGSKVHERIQEYLFDMGLLLISEVPIKNSVYSIQGHTDGILKLSDNEIGVLELKSINANGFEQLKSAKESHALQALIYLFCLEERRQELRHNFKSINLFDHYENDRCKYYESMYQHLKDGDKYTREEKIAHQVNLHALSDRILMSIAEPITKCVLVYENKNDQQLKEFVISTDSNDTKQKLKYALDYCVDLNWAVKNNELPEREGASKSDSTCRWCQYSNQCWVV